VKASPNRRALPASGIRSATILTIISAIIFAIAMWETLRGNLSPTMAEVSAAVALLTFGLLIYGVLQMILSLIESAGERRRQEREATERRKARRSETTGEER
jgi:hypothetical protein